MVIVHISLATTIVDLPFHPVAGFHQKQVQVESLDNHMLSRGEDYCQLTNQLQVYLGGRLIFIYVLLVASLLHCNSRDGVTMVLEDFVKMPNIQRVQKISNSCMQAREVRAGSTPYSPFSKVQNQ